MSAGTPDLAVLLVSASPGGLVDLEPTSDLGALAGAAEDLGARVAILRGPRSKAELLDGLAEELAFPGWFGRNWDALDELLAFPDPPDERATLVIWDDAERLAAFDPASAGMARDVFASAAASRAAAGAAPLVLLIRPGGPP